MEYLFITLAVLCTSLGQITQKIVAQRYLGRNTSLATLLPVLLKKETLLAISLLLLGMIFWLLTLRTMEVSKAFPFLSSGFIVVLIFSRFWLKEHIPWFRWLGVTLICVGLSIISQT